MTAPESTFPHSEPLAQQGPGYWYDGFEWDSSDKDDSNSNNSDDDWLPGEPPEDWDYYLENTSRPVTPEDLDNNCNWEHLPELLNPLLTPLPMDSSTTRKCRASQPAPSATSLATSSAPTSSSIPPLKKVLSKSTWAKECSEGGKNWPPKMLSE